MKAWPFAAVGSFAGNRRSNVRATAQQRWSDRFGGIPRPEFEILTCGRRITTERWGRSGSMSEMAASQPVGGFR